MTHHTSQMYDGTSALKAYEHQRPTLMLVHDARRAGDAPRAAKVRRRTSSHVKSKPMASPFILYAGAAIMLVVVVCSFTLDAMRHHGVTALLDEAPTKTIHAVPGDTLWTIAEECGTSENVTTTDVIHWIRNRNGLHTSALGVGQELLVPLMRSQASSPDVADTAVGAAVRQP